MKKFCLLTLSLLAFLLSFNFFLIKSLAIAEDAAVKVNYELPYPGLLPDSPLYFLRIIRDKTVGFLISDPLKKSEFNLLQADKRLNAGITLFNKGKISLGLSTVSKAENYFEKSIDKLGEARTQGEVINDLQGRLKTAVKKHRQELEFLSKRADVNFKSGFEKELERVAGFEKRLNR